MINRYAQLLYGKILYIYETPLNLEDLSIIFSPKTYWVDVTGMSCEVGYLVDYRENVGLIFTPPPTTVLTLEEIKLHKIELLKVERDKRESDVIEYKGKFFDYDDKARERMRISEKALIDNNIESQEWTCADNTKTMLTVADFKAINTIAARRSGILHDKYNALKELINKCITNKELEAITFDTETTV